MTEVRFGGEATGPRSLLGVTLPRRQVSPREKMRCVHVYVGRCREDSNVVLSHDHTDVPIDSTVRLTCSHRSIVSKAL